MSESASTCGQVVRGERGEGEVWRWAAGCAIAAIAVSALMVAVVLMPSAAEANREACMRAHGGDLHADLAAFAQDPGAQDLFVEALAACSR
jgi:cysteine synthase